MGTAQELKKTDRDELLSTLYESLPDPVLVVDADMSILLHNSAAAKLFTPDNPQLIWRKGGEVFGCISSREAGCGKGGDCSSCIIRSAVQEAHAGRRVERRRSKVERLRDGQNSDFHLLVTAVPLRHNNLDLVALILEDVSELIQLRSLLPICAGCKKIRSDTNSWESLESHLSNHLQVDFSHSLCPNCAASLYPKEEIEG